MNDDANLTTPENNTKVVETTENNSASSTIETSVLPEGHVLETALVEVETPAIDSKTIENTVTNDLLADEEEPGIKRVEDILTPAPETVVGKVLATDEVNLIQETSSLIENDTIALDDVHHDTDEVSTHHDNLEVAGLHYDSLSKKELLKAAQEACLLDNLRDAADKLKAIRPAYENIIREEQQKALAEFIEGGGDREAYVTHIDLTKDLFYATFETLKKRKEEQRIQIEKQKLDNLKSKQDILEKIKAIVDGEESKDSIEQIKFLQSEWKRIKVIPQEHSQKLWDTYSFYIDKFYDNRSIYYELKELDRQKNLSAKIELCLRVDELKNQSSMKQCIILLNKYHEDWKSIGPVPKEVSEELWQRFKGASDIVHDKYRVYITELEAIQTVNLQLKKELVIRAQEIAMKPIEKGKDWNERSKDYETLLGEWKKIGMVPREHNTIWDNFRGIIDEFYKQKNGHFKELNKVRMENFRKKEELCIKAEALKESTEWGKTSKELVRLQDEWKGIGAVPDKYNESIWKRFRSACDLFFNTKNEKFASQKTEHSQNMETKNGICSRLEEMSKSEDFSAMANEVRALQDQWNATGHVDIKVKDAIYKRYNSALDIVYAILRKNNSEFEQNQNKQRYESISAQQDGKFKLQSESRRLQDRIRVLQENIDTLQNNILFFANSKNAESLKKKVEDDISAHQKNIIKLKEQLQVLRGLQTVQPAK